MPLADWLLSLFSPGQAASALRPGPGAGWRTVRLPCGVPLMLWAAGRYDDQLAEAIRRAKYGPRWSAACELTRLLPQTQRSGLWGLKPILVPMPPDPGRLPSRGFHLPAEMAKQLGRLSGCPVGLRTLDKPASTPMQAGRTRAARLEALRGQFQVRAPVAHQAVLLVDDVLTTGATLSTACSTLENAGARVIGAIVLAVVEPARVQSIRSRHVRRPIPRRPG